MWEYRSKWYQPHAPGPLSTYTLCHFTPTKIEFTFLTITIEDLGTRLVKWHRGRHGSRWIRLTFVRQGTMEVHTWTYLSNWSSLQLYACCWQEKMWSWACPQGTASRSSFRCFLLHNLSNESCESTSGCFMHHHSHCYGRLSTDIADGWSSGQIN